MEVPIIGLAEKSYVNHNWKFFEVIKTIKKYDIEYIAFFKNIYDEKSEEDKDNYFFQQLYMNKIPLWLKQIYNDDNVSLFKVNEAIISKE